MATITINKAKSKTKTGKWFTFIVNDITIINGKMYLIPQNEKYQYYKLLIDDCIIIN